MAPTSTGGCCRGEGCERALRILGRTPVAVVCAGAKAILDLPRTLEVLETLGVPVVGFGTDRLPAFYSRESPWRVPHRVDRLEDLARQVATHLALEPATGMVIAQPPPRDLSLDFDRVEAWIAAAHATAADHGVSGRR